MIERDQSVKANTNRTAAVSSLESLLRRHFRQLHSTNESQKLTPTATYAWKTVVAPWWQMEGQHVVTKIQEVPDLHETPVPFSTKIPLPHSESLIADYTSIAEYTITEYGGDIGLAFTRSTQRIARYLEEHQKHAVYFIPRKRDRRLPARLPVLAHFTAALHGYSVFYPQKNPSIDFTAPYWPKETAHPTAIISLADQIESGVVANLLQKAQSLNGNRTTTHSLPEDPW